MTLQCFFLKYNVAINTFCTWCHLQCSYDFHATWKESLSVYQHLLLCSSIYLLLIPITIDMFVLLTIAIIKSTGLILCGFILCMVFLIDSKSGLLIGESSQHSFISCKHNSTKYVNYWRNYKQDMKESNDIIYFFLSNDIFL